MQVAANSWMGQEDVFISWLMFRHTTHRKDSIKAVELIVASVTTAGLIQSLAANILNLYQVFEANRALKFSIGLLICLVSTFSGRPAF